LISSSSLQTFYRRRVHKEKPITPESFQEAVEEAADQYLTEHPKSYSIEYDLSDPDTPLAEITITMFDRSTWNIGITLNEQGELGVVLEGQDPLPLTAESFYVVLWFEAMYRLNNARN